MKRFDALVVLLRTVGVCCGVYGIATLGQYLALTQQDEGTQHYTSLLLPMPIVFLAASPLLIWGAKFCARLCGESDDLDEEEDSSN